MFRLLLTGGSAGAVDVMRLKKMGMVVGKNVNVMDDVVLDYSHCWLIKIGNNVTIAPGVRIIAHDASTKSHLGITRIGLVSIGDNTFVGANCLILPDVRIGSNVIIGAGSVVTSDIPDDSVAAGNPAKVIMSTGEYLSMHTKRMKTRPVFDKSWTIPKISNAMKKEMITRLRDGIGYVE
jgi:maltose O-acetyltransferase